MSTAQQSGAIEVVMYRSRPGVSDDQVIAASDALQADVIRCAGYQSRRLLKNEDGLWLDIVDWSDLDHALQAGEAILAKPSAAQFMALVQEESVQMIHLAPRRIYAASGA